MKAISIILAIAILLLAGLYLYLLLEEKKLPTKTIPVSFSSDVWRGDGTDVVTRKMKVYVGPYFKPLCDYLGGRMTTDSVIQGGIPVDAYDPVSGEKIVLKKYCRPENWYP